MYERTEYFQLFILFSYRIIFFRFQNISNNFTVMRFWKTEVLGRRQGKDLIRHMPNTTVKL